MVRPMWQFRLEECLFQRVQPDVQADLSGVSTAIVVQNNLINVSIIS